jgi:Tfp pilus assembly protein PilF
MGRIDEAIEECRKAILQDPDFGNPYNDIGAYLIEKGEFDEAIPWFQKAMQARRYESPAFPHLNLGRVYERKGMWTEAIECYKKALALNPDYALAKKSLGRLISSLN